MNVSNRVSQTLHDEHGATVALMEQLEAFLARHRRNAPAVGEPGMSQLMLELFTGVAAEVQRHFDFEENHLFTYLEANGDKAIGAHLTDEHTAMRPLGARLAELARIAAAQGFDAAQWEEFRSLGEEFIERMLAHVQKEEMALLPLIDMTMDPETEARLYEVYTEI